MQSLPMAVGCPSMRSSRMHCCSRWMISLLLVILFGSPDSSKNAVLTALTVASMPRTRLCFVGHFVEVDVTTLVTSVRVCAAMLHRMASGPACCWLACSARPDYPPSGAACLMVPSHQLACCCVNIVAQVPVQQPESSLPGGLSAMNLQLQAC